MKFSHTYICIIFKGYRPCRRPLSWAIWFKSWWRLTGPSTWTQNATQPSPDTPKTATSRRSTQNSQTPPKSGRKPSKKPSPAACRSDKSETHKGEGTGSSTWTQNATQPSPDTPKTATSRRSTQNSQTPPKSGRKPSKKPSPAACRSDKSETHKGEGTGSSTWTQNATQPSPETPKTATSRRSTQNIQTPPKSGRKPSKKPSPAACRSDKSETHKGEGTGSSTWTQNATQPSPETPKTATSRRSTQNIQTPPKSGRKPSKKTLPRSVPKWQVWKPIKEKEQAPARGHRTQRNLAQTRPKTATSRRSTQNIQTPPKSGRKPSKKPSPAACRSDKSETPKGEGTGPSTWTQNATQPSPDTPKTATSRPSTQNSQTPPKSGRKPSKKTSPAACRSDKSETPKGEGTGSSTWTQNATQPSPDTPKTATSRRSTQNIQTPPKSGRKPSKKPSPAACRSDKSETPKGEGTGPSTWTQNATQPSPDTPKTATLPAIDSKHPNTT